MPGMDLMGNINNGDGDGSGGSRIDLMGRPLVSDQNNMVYQMQ